MLKKKELRERLRRLLVQIEPDSLRERSQQACARLAQQPEFQRAEIVMVFLSTTHEVDTSNLVLRAWEMRKRVVAPRISWEQRRLLPTEIRSLTDNITQGPLGIRVPVSGVPIPVADIDLVLVPGLGFDLHGIRLGRGRGFYDRFLDHRDFRGTACGLALAEQVVDDLPAVPHDRPVHMLATDREVLRFSRPDQSRVASDQ